MFKTAIDSYKIKTIHIANIIFDVRPKTVILAISLLGGLHIKNKDNLLSRSVLLNLTYRETRETY